MLILMHKYVIEIAMRVISWIKEYLMKEYLMNLWLEVVNYF